MTQEQSPKSLFMDSFAKAQSSVEGAEKDGKNPHFKNVYSTLTSCWLACKDALASNGFSIMQGGKKIDEHWVLETKLCHTSGHDETYHFPLLLGKNDMQGLGSAITYARRYGLCSMVGVAPEDDDGEEARKSGPAKNPEGINPERDGRDLRTQAGDLYLSLKQAPNLSALDDKYNHNPSKKVMAKLAEEGETDILQKLEDLFNTRSAIFQKASDQARSDIDTLSNVIN
jgi:hypothetical protein